MRHAISSTTAVEKGISPIIRINVLIPFLNVLIPFMQGCGSAPKTASIVPPPMPRRAIAQPATAPAGEQIEIEKGYTLFVPDLWRESRQSSCGLYNHFHTQAWVSSHGHLQRG